MTEIRFAPIEITDEALRTCSALLCEVFGDDPKFHLPALAWRYRDNPYGSALGFNAWVGARLVAHYAALPHKALIEGAPFMGILGVNNATHPSMQGRGLLTQTAELTFADAAEKGFDFVNGVANANSTHPMTRKLGYQLVAPLEGGFMLAPPRELKPAPAAFATVRDATWYRWRIQSPLVRYSVARQGALTRISAPTGLPGVRCAAYVADGDGLEPASFEAPFAHLYLGADPRLSFAPPRFVAIPKALRPSPLNFVYRSFGRAPGKLSSALQFDFLDFDPY